MSSSHKPEEFTVHGYSGSVVKRRCVNVKEWFSSNDSGRMKQLLFTACILLIFVPTVLCKTVPSCPHGQIQYETKDANHICCVPIVAPNFCGLHVRVQRCIEDGKPDTCVKCEDGLEKFFNSTSEAEAEDRCYRPLVCAEEAIPSLTKIGQCECDQSRCYYGDQFGCTHFSSKCEENTYHKNGACVPCPEGTHRPGIGCGPCEPMSLLPSPVNNISLPNPNSANSPTTVPNEVPRKSPVPGLTITEKDNVLEVDEAVDSGSLSGFPTWAIILIVLVGLILIVIIILPLVRWFRNGRRNETGPVRVPSSSSGVSANDGAHPSLPPPYSESQNNQTLWSQGQPCHINQNAGYCSGGTPERCSNQTAKPFQNCRYDTPSEHPINGVSESFQPGQPSSTSSIHLPSNGFSSGSSGPLDPLSMAGGAPDQTQRKFAGGGQESVGEQQRVATKPPSGVVPVDGDEDNDDAPLLRSAPRLDPDSIKDTKPFQNCRYDTPSEHPINGVSESFQPGQPSSTSSIHLPSNGFSSGSSGPLDPLSMAGGAPDQTQRKFAGGGQESVGEQQRVATKPPSGVVPVDGDEDNDDAPLLRSAPRLDPDSIKDSQ